MAEMQAKQRHAEKIEPRHPNIVEAHDHHSENIMPLLRIDEAHKTLSSQVDVLHLRGEVQQVINHKNKNDDPAHEHRARSVTGADRLVLRVTDRARGFILQR